MKRISVLLAALSLFVAGSAFADQLTVKITAFTAIGDLAQAGGHLGEVCGLVSGSTDIAKGEAHVRVTSDPNTGNPGIYVVSPDQSGNFCTIILTYSGTAQADAFVGGRASGSTVATAHIGSATR